MKRHVKVEFETIIKVLNSVSYRKHCDLSITSRCFNKRCGYYSVIITSSFVSSIVYERISEIVRKYDLIMFFSAFDNVVRIHIQ